MQKYRVEISFSVYEELESYAHYIAQDSVSAALGWYERMEKKIETLEESPERCMVSKDSQYCDYEIRHLIVGNYRILFRIEGDVVKVLHVFHGAMDSKQHL